uniref:EF-hand domain-containing protein n=1 Tax=Haptolina ericina TaxID=156174 RepID=A0A7S3B7P0_9EUKA|mmetsp:Transcript_53105/g.119175  ORF Transcript_53105/g.119175 Transcript_53105/m.119175 type:complete len:234 (+) Transcript_53105:36-737(+)
MASINAIRTSFMNKLESKLPGGKSLSPQILKKTLNHFDADQDGWLTFAEFLQCADGKIEAETAEYLFMFWDTLAGEQEPCGMVSIDYAVADLLGSQPQYSTLLKGNDLVSIAGRGQGNRPSQEGGIFGGGMYAAESERDKGRSRPLAAVDNVAPPAEPVVPAMRKLVNNESSIEGGIFGAAPASYEPPPSARSNRSNMSSVQGGIFGQDAAPQQPHRGGRNPNASSIPGGIFG